MIDELIIFRGNKRYIHCPSFHCRCDLGGNVHSGCARLATATYHMVGNAIIHDIVASLLRPRHAPAPPPVSCGLFVCLRQIISVVHPSRMMSDFPSSLPKRDTMGGQVSFIFNSHLYFVVVKW